MNNSAAAASASAVDDANSKENDEEKKSDDERVGWEHVFEKPYRAPEPEVVQPQDLMCGCDDPQDQKQINLEEQNK